MIRDITLGQYFPGNSVIHKLDPRVKIILALLYMLVIFFAEELVGYFIIAGFTYAIVRFSNIPIKLVFKGLKPLIVIIAFTAFFNIFMAGGVQIFKIGPLIATYEGIISATMMILRLVFLVTGTSLLTYTTSPILLTDGLERLLNPFKRIGVPAHELAMMMTIALRFIPTLLEETDKIMKAQISRGADFESGNLIKRARGLVPLMVPLFISAFRRADELAIAMEARCYRGGEQRTKMKQLSMHKRDYMAFAIFIIFSLALFIR